MLTYEQSLAFIHGIARFGSKPGLRRVRMLLERMGNPQERLRFLHVAGTDGKGSTCTMLSNIYTEAGYRVGLYISPYVLNFRERIQLCGEMIPEEDLAASTTAVKAHWDALDAIGETPTEFEVVVAVAMDYFLRMRCDLVVLEVGMGGRFDATNIIGPPVCSVITHISLDHTQYLGDSIAQIAFEKCGIIKKAKEGESGVTICYPDQPEEALAVIRQRCTEEENTLRIARPLETLEASLFGSRVRAGGLEFHLPLPGAHQVLNTATVLETVAAVEERGFSATPEQIIRGLERTRFPSRVEVLHREPAVLLDGGHNPAEATALAATLALLPPEKKVHAVIGMLADKDVNACLAAILPRCARMTAITPDYPRALEAEKLAESARAYCSQVVVGPAGGTDKATVLAEAFASLTSGRDDVLLCCGSLYLSSELRPLLLERVGELGPPAPLG